VEQHGKTTSKNNEENLQRLKWLRSKGRVDFAGDVTRRVRMRLRSRCARMFREMLWEINPGH
jgi:hypothetical protein